MTMRTQAVESALLQIALDLSASLPRKQQYQRLIVALNQVLPCDACTLLCLDDGVLVPVAVDGLVPDVMQQRFPPAQHPRLNAILSSRKPIRFPENSDLPDPFDGLLLLDQSSKLDVHSCMGCSLYVDDTLVGVLTLDSMRESAFDDVEDVTVATFAALAAATIRNAAMIEALEAQSEHDRVLMSELVRDVARSHSDIIGDSQVMQNLKNEIQVVAASDITVLIEGETGTGKELIAHQIHALSPRSDTPMVHVNCAALPESLAESELFGHLKGAYTGAHQSRAGKFELADGGTLFLDEIGELPQTIQAKILRAIQQGEVQRVGSDKLIKVDVRIVAATNRNLLQEVEQGNFRSDLYHRLCVYPLRVPALRERIEDVTMLVKQFLHQSKRKLGLKQLCMSQEATDQLLAYDWPGNVRELEHLVLRASLKALRRNTKNTIVGQKGRVEVDGADLGIQGEAISVIDSPAAAGANIPMAGSLTEQMEQFQRQRIRQALDENNGVWAQAAKTLGMNRSNLHRLAKRLGMLN